VRYPLSGNLRLVEGWPALLLGRTLVISDVHLGIEKELWREGVRASNISDLALDRFRELLEITKPSKIIIDGDLKHNIPVFTRREAEKVKEFIELGESYGRVLVVKGNHDGGLENIIDNVVGGVVREDKFYITHGHMNIPHRPVIIGHLHPAFPLETGFRKEPIKVWLMNEEVLVLPAFSPFILGNDITRPENWLGPIARREKQFDVFSLEGHYLGEIKKEE
jgi:putative SbcD/Mre11-related phosphoesterase